MISRIVRKISRIFDLRKRIDRILFKIFSKVLKKYDVKIYYRDDLGILSAREYSDNFEYIFKTKNSCDAVPMMLALSDKIQKSQLMLERILGLLLFGCQDSVIGFIPLNRRIVTLIGLPIT